MGEAIRIPPEETRQKVTSDAALLVCAYEDEEKCNPLLLEGAISLTAFRSQLPDLPKDRETSSTVHETTKRPPPVRRRDMRKRDTRISRFSVEELMVGKMRGIPS